VFHASVGNLSSLARLWRNWSTRTVQVRVGASPWGFESLQPHSEPMHPASVVDEALALAAAGASATDIARMIGIPRETIRGWMAGQTPRRPNAYACGRCGAVHDFASLPEAYVYLLGLYLGDGYIARHPRNVHRLRIVLDVRYPGFIDSAAGAIREVRDGRALVQLRANNCVEVSSYWRSWPCLFPQHGPGKKHERRIGLMDWQLQLVDQWPEQLLRGLIHSDGCRFENTGTNWSWPRYAFDNRSDDIRAIFGRACDALGLRWTASGETRIYVSRKEDVAVLDGFIGPKR
jgi:hypothetical protein